MATENKPASKSAWLLLLATVVVGLIIWTVGRQQGWFGDGAQPRQLTVQRRAPGPQSQSPQPSPSGPVQGNDRSYCYGGIPRSKAVVKILTNTGYMVGYSEEKRSPLWVAYRLFKTDNRLDKRPEHFELDGRVASQLASGDYARTGYDRGHLAPNDAIDNCYGPKAQVETFLMTNIIPQRPNLNRRVWNQLERLITYEFAGRFEEVWVFTGPVFRADGEHLPCGAEVPGACYKIVVDEENGHPRVLVFVLPQTVTGSEPPNQFLSSVRQVETDTGLDFLWALPDAVEEPLETEASQGMW